MTVVGVAGGISGKQVTYDIVPKYRPCIPVCSEFEKRMTPHDVCLLSVAKATLTDCARRTQWLNEAIFAPSVTLDG